METGVAESMAWTFRVRVGVGWTRPGNCGEDVVEIRSRK